MRAMTDQRCGPSSAETRSRSHVGCRNGVMSAYRRGPLHRSQRARACSAHAPAVSALDRDWLLYRVRLILSASPDLLPDHADDVATELGTLVPLEVTVERGRLALVVLVTAPSAEVAAWRTVEVAQKLPRLNLELVSAALPHDRLPRVVLRRDLPSHRDHGSVQ